MAPRRRPLKRRTSLTANRRLVFEPLEDRRLLATFIVNSTADDKGDSYDEDGICDTANDPLAEPPVPPSGICTLWAAAEQANHNGGSNVVHFDIPGGGIPVVDSNHAVFFGPVEVDGTTQSAGMVEIRGSLSIGGGDSLVTGLLISRGVLALLSSNNTVVGNFIGTNPTGTAPSGFGIAYLSIDGDNNRIGGTDPAERNVIAAGASSAIAIVIDGNHNRIWGNYIGTDVTGEITDPDGVPGSGDEFKGGVRVSGGSQNEIGGDTPAHGNVIAGGIQLNSSGQPVVETRIENNSIGTNKAGTAVLGDGALGILVQQSTDNSILNNVIAGARFNGVFSGDGSGIFLSDGAHRNMIRGNKIGTNAAGTVTDPDGVPNSGDEFGNRDYGISINPGGRSATGNIIGGSDPADANVIAGNGIGVRLFHGAEGNTIEGNFIGTNADGTAALPNGTGVEIQFSSRNVVGGTRPNIISGNAQYGIVIAGAAATDNLIANNRIGTNAAGTAALANQTGVLINDGPANCIGGVLPANLAAASLCGALPGGSSTYRGNLISGNTQFGVQIANANANNNTVRANRIGTEDTGTTALPNGWDGVAIVAGADDNLIGGNQAAHRNLISGNLGDGVLIIGDGLNSASGNTVSGNYIGVDVTGGIALANKARGVHLDGNSTGNTIGGDAPSWRNVISGNGQDGVLIYGAASSDNVVKNNYVGTNQAGTAAVPNNDNGIYIWNSPRNRIGEVVGTAQFGNLISGNKATGIKIEGNAAVGNFIAANLIGLDGSGTGRLANISHGIHVLNAAETRIGSSLTGEPPLSGNTISANLNGVLIEGSGATNTVIGGNRIGTDWQGKLADTPSFLGNTVNGIWIRNASETYIGGLFLRDGQATQIPGNTIAANVVGVRIEGASAVFNKIQRNAIFENTGLGIDLGGDGVTPNDTLDADNGPNGLQNFPVIDRLGLDSQLRGTFNSLPDEEFTLDLYKSAKADPSGNGEGQFWLGAVTVTTNAVGDASFEIPVIFDPDAPYFTLTATDGAGNTSEFSGPLLQPDLSVDPFTLWPQQVVRRGQQFFLPYEITVRNIGTAEAVDAPFRITGNNVSIPGAGGLITLDAGQSFLFSGEWEVTSQILASPRGAAALEIKVTANPNNLIDELSNENNYRSSLTSVDGRPVITMIKKEFAQGIFLADVTLPNTVEVFVDWNGNLDGVTIGGSDRPQLLVRLNGVDLLLNEGDPSLSEVIPSTFTIDMGADLQAGPNEITVRAETRLHDFTSDTGTIRYQQGRTMVRLDAAVFSVFTTGGPYEKVAEYKAGFYVPQLGVENTTDVSGYYNLPADRVGFAGGALGATIPRGLARVTIRSDGSTVLQGMMTFEASVGNDKVGGTDGGVVIVLKGDLSLVNNDYQVDKLEGQFRLQATVKTPRVPLPSFPVVSVQGKIGVGVDGTLAFERKDDQLQFKNVVLGMNNFAEVVGSIGQGKLAQLEWGGGGAMRAEFQLPADPCLTKSASVLLFVRVKAKFLVFEAQKAFRLPLELTGCSASATAGAAGEAEPGVAAFSEARELTDIRLSPRYLPRRDADGEGSMADLPEVFYPYAQPALARHGDGTMTLVFVSEDATKADGQHLEMFAAHYDGSAWSAPVQLTDDALIDDAPSVAYDTNGNAIAAWSRLKNPIVDAANADPQSLLGELEIVYAVRDAATGAWSVPVALTDDAVLDHKPQLQTDAAGNVMAVWLRDSGNDLPIFPDDATPLDADFQFSIWDGNAWSLPAVAVSGVKATDAPRFALGDDDGLLVWSQDGDGDATTDADREIHVSIWNGTSWSAANLLGGAADGVADVEPQVVLDATGRANIAWIRAGVALSAEEADLADQLFFVERVAGQFSAPQMAVQSDAISGLRLTLDSGGNPLLVWQSLSDSGPDIFYGLFDRASGSWSGPIQFTDDGDLEWWFSPFINGDGELEILHLSRQLGSETMPTADPGDGEGETIESVDIVTFTSSSLETAVQVLGRDLAVEAVTLSEANPAPGSTVQVAATVHNRGFYATGASSAVLRDDGNQVGAEQVVPALAAGETAVLTFAWQVPLDPAAPHTLLVAVDPGDTLAETDEANNAFSLVTLLPNVTVENLDVRTTAHAMTVTASIFNRGASPTLAPFDVALRLDDPRTGATLATTTLSDSIPAGGSAEVVFTIDDPFQTFDAVHVGFVVADAGGAIDESEESDNDAFAAVNPFLSWQNPINGLDVDRDSAVEPVDVLLVVNDLNARGARLLPIVPRPPFFLDVDGDGFVTPADVLLIINFINGRGGPTGEGEETLVAWQQPLVLPPLPYEAPLSADRHVSVLARIPTNPWDAGTEGLSSDGLRVRPVVAPSRRDEAVRLDGLAERIGREVRSITEDDFASLLDELVADVAGADLSLAAG